MNPNRTPPVYLVAELEVRDAETMRRYATEVRPVLESFGGRILSTFPPGPAPVEGDWRPQVLVIQEWPSADAFHAFWSSADYAPLRDLRRAAARSRIVTVAGLSPDDAGTAGPEADEGSIGARVASGDRCGSVMDGSVG